jgi:hypothetical protein
VHSLLLDNECYVKDSFALHLFNGQRERASSIIIIIIIVIVILTTCKCALESMGHKLLPETFHSFR